jgi:tRNA nucleotidyltransferase (CCA-adding enzyme)
MQDDKEILIEALFSRYSIKYWDELCRIIPELKPNTNLPQNPAYHPEGPVHIHICKVIDNCAEDHDIDLSLCALFHDIGKAKAHQVKRMPDGTKKISHILHEKYSTEILDKYQNLIESVGGNFEKIRSIVANHMRTHMYENGKLKDPKKRKAFEELPEFDNLIRFAKADDEGKN